MKSLTILVLTLAGFFSSAIARGDGAMRVLRGGITPCDGTIKVLNDRGKQLVVWLQMVRVAEETYKSKHSRYADLSHLCKAHLLDELVFESDSARSPQSKSAANYVPATTIFQVIVSSHGQHFRASIREREASVAAGEQGGWSINSQISCSHPQAPILDGPQGPAFESNQYVPDLQSIDWPSSFES